MLIMGKTRRMDTCEKASRDRFLKLVERQEQRKIQALEADKSHVKESPLKKPKPFSYNKTYLYANMRPLYLQIQNGTHGVAYGNLYHIEQGLPKLGSKSANGTAHRNYSEALNQSWPQSQGRHSSRKLALLQPLDHQYQQSGLYRVYNEQGVSSHPHVSMSPSNLPPLDRRLQSRWVADDQYLQRNQENQRSRRWSRRQEESPGRQAITDQESGPKPVLARQSKFLKPEDTNGLAAQPQPARFVSPVSSPNELRDPSPIEPLVPSSPSPLLQRQDVNVTLPQAASSQSLQVEDLSGDNEDVITRPPSPIDVQPDSLEVKEEKLSTPPPLASPQLDLAPVRDVVDATSPLLRKKFDKHSGKSRLKPSRPTPKKDKPAGPAITPFDNPKEALTRMLQQLEHPEWEVTIQGLQSLVRLAVHHSSLLPPVMHQVVVAVTRHVRCLRSQVSRFACTAATTLFSHASRGIENDRDVEELCAVLLNRTADTNKFLRADCNAALDAMVDHFSTSKMVSCIVSKGAKHQNAIVRATSCRLLLRLCQRLGPERVLSLGKETRDTILNTGARSLTEGSLDTRRYAKEMFILLSQDVRLMNMLSEVVPSTVMRSISKVLARIIVK